MYRFGISLMHKSKCPVCGSSHTVKNGRRKGKQVYKCADCGYQFRNDSLPDDFHLWKLYQDSKQTVKELAEQFDVSESTIKRRLRNVSIEWEQPSLSGGGFVHLDATGRVLYLEFIKNETNADYESAVRSIEERGYEVKGLVIDGKQGLFGVFNDYKIQMCQFHMKQIIRRYLTLNPRLKAACALKGLIGSLTTANRFAFEQNYRAWKEEWNSTLNRRTQLKSGRTQYTHKRLRSAMHSVDFYLPYLFTYQMAACEGMPNTNNKIEGTFTDLKKNLNNHSGMTEENRKRFICGFFSALIKPLA